MMLPADFRDWPSEAKLAHWQTYMSQDGTGLLYAERLRLATEQVREAYSLAAAMKLGSMQP